MSSPATVQRLRTAGERVTPQRLAIAEALVDAGSQLTAQELYKRVRRRHPSIGRATIFRTLEALVASGVARRLEQEGHVYGYVACRAEHHHHLSCTACGRVVEIGEAYIRSLADRLSAELGFEIDDARLDFYGRCADCR